MANDKEKLIKELISEGYLKNLRIIEAFRAVDRIDFMPYEFQHEAYGNYPLSIGFDQTVSQPLTVAFMLELLEPGPGEKILDVGFGSGWTAALLAHLVGEKGRVVAIERIPEICEFGSKNVAKYNFGELVLLICGDGTQILNEGPFDKILAGAAAPNDIPQEWRNELKVGGRIVAPVGESVVVFNKKSEIEWDEVQYPGFSFVPLIKETGEAKKVKAGGNDDIILDVTKRKPHRTIGYWLLAIGLAATVLANEIYFPHTSFSGSKSIEIPRGLGSDEIAELLKNEGVIRSKWAFLSYATLTFSSYRLKPGDYVFNRDPIHVIVNKLLEGGTNERVLVIPEGWNVGDIGIYLENLGMFQQEEFLELVGFPHVDYSKNKPRNTTSATSIPDPTAVGSAEVDIRGKEMPLPKDFSWRLDFLVDKSGRVGLEGYLFPDTYRIFKEATAEDIVLKMLENFGRKLTQEFREEIKRQKKTIFEIVTMASLIEKEVISDEDRALVSGVFWKRLEAGVPLQVDATITYITGKKSTKVSKEDTEIDSPLNTYKYRGLPLGPISNPGISAIRAAIYPKPSPYWFYLSTPDGKTIFSKTIDEHNEAKARYLH